MKLLLLLLFLYAVTAKRVELDWNLKYKNVNADGLFERRVISINDQWPPLPVELNVNDILVIHLQNNLNEVTVIHAHGINQNNGTNHMDGAGMVTQCPIPANHNFTYEFPVTQAGTFWIHSHYKVQYMDGLRVPLVVRDIHEPFHWDEDQIISLSDWYHQDSYTNLEQYMNHDNIEGVEPIPQSGLINDHVNSTISFKPNKTYRLRFVNMAGIATFNVYLDGHDMQVIEVDGIPTQPTRTGLIYLAAGQRVSVLVKTKSTTDLNYILHANMNPAMFDYIPDGLKLNIEAPIYYDKDAPFAPLDDPKKIENHYSDANIFPLKASPPLVADRQINMTVDFMENTDGLNHGVINDIPYLSPLVPSLNTLMTIEENLVNDTRVYGPQSQTIIADLDQVLEIVINNLDDGPHPFHLHGHSFQVIARGDGVYSKDTVIVEPINPTVRDTIVVTPEGYVVLRFRANNPGVWFFHCHVDWHLPAGLAATFITAPKLARQQFEALPDIMYDICTLSGLPAKGNAAGKKGLDLEGAPDGVRPIKNPLILGCIIATLVGISTIIWHVWVDPTSSQHEEEDEDQKRLLE